MFCELDIFRFFFFNDTATTEIYTLSLHDALPICARPHGAEAARVGARRDGPDPRERVHLVHDRDLLGGEPELIGDDLRDDRLMALALRCRAENRDDTPERIDLDRRRVDGARLR